MNRVLKWTKKIALALLVVAATVVLGITLGVGGLIVALLVGGALIWRRHPSAVAFSRHRVNPATGMRMRNRFFDIGGNPYGTSDDD